VEIKVLLADDHTLLREGLRVQIERLPGLSVLAEAGNGRQAVRLALKLKPDLVIMDVSMPELNGFEATRQILAQLPKAVIIALSMHKNRSFVARMLKAGAKGYVLKESAFAEIADAIRWTAAGKTYLSPLVADIVLEGFLQAEDQHSTSILSQLSGREREVMQLAVEGKSNPQIAEILHISVRTVETHRKNMMGKLKVNDITELIKAALKEGVITLE
jgi:two-component system, NarL family, response regulator NreC